MAASETVGDRVRRYRRLKKWTKEELAFAAKIDRSYLGKLEAGTVDGAPGVDWIGRVARALGVSKRTIAEPLGWYDDEKPKGTVDTMEEIERAIIANSDLDEEQKSGLILSARLLVAPHIQEAQRRRQKRHSA